MAFHVKDTKEMIRIATFYMLRKRILDRVFVVQDLDVHVPIVPQTRRQY